VRKAKLAYVESTAGPKFNKSKAATVSLAQNGLTSDLVLCLEFYVSGFSQIKTGMSSLKTREDKGSGRSHGSSASSGGGGNSAANILIEPAAVIIAGGRSRSGGGGGGGSSSVSAREVSYAVKKPKKAPLMQKTLKSMKTLMRR